MTPPDPAPSPLEALLKEVDRAVGVDTSTLYGVGVMDRLKARAELSTAAPRLAAIVRVLRAELREIDRLHADTVGRSSFFRTLRRADEIAEGK